MGFSQSGGKPGPQPQFQGIRREVFYANRDHAQFVPKPTTLDGTLTSWADNQPYPYFIPAGTILGRVTATGKWRPSIIGLSTAAYVSGATSLTVTTGTATEVARLIAQAGGSITLYIDGPPTASGTNAQISTTCSAASGTTLTITNLAANVVTGALVQPGDGSQTALSVLCDMEGLKVTDATNVNRVDCFDPEILLMGGTIDTNMLINWPADSSIQTFLLTAIKAYCPAVAFYSQL